MRGKENEVYILEEFTDFGNQLSSELYSYEQHKSTAYIVVWNKLENWSHVKHQPTVAVYNSQEVCNHIKLVTHVAYPC